MPKVMASAPNAGGRHQRGRRIGPSLSEMNVIPLVDVMLVLLIIFMIAAPMLHRGVEVNLPVAAQSQEIASERLYVDVPLSYRDDGRVFLVATGGQEEEAPEGISLDFLPERVRQQLGDRTERQIFVRADGGLQVQDLIDVLERSKEGGVEQVGIVTELPVTRRR
jgi:biopolymer transport protein TolR